MVVHRKEPCEHAGGTSMEIDDKENSASRERGDNRMSEDPEVSIVKDGGGSKLSKSEGHGASDVSEDGTASGPMGNNGGVDARQVIGETATGSNITVGIAGSEEGDDGALGGGGEAEGTKGGSKTANGPEEKDSCGTVSVTKENEVAIAGATAAEGHSGEATGGSEDKGGDETTGDSSGTANKSPVQSTENVSFGATSGSKKKENKEAISSKERGCAQSTSSLTTGENDANDGPKEQAGRGTISTSRKKGRGAANAVSKKVGGETAGDPRKNVSNGTDNSFKETEDGVTDGSKASAGSRSVTASKGTGGGGTRAGPKKKGSSGTVSGPKRKESDETALNRKQDGGVSDDPRAKRNDNTGSSAQGNSSSSSKINENPAEELVVVKLHAFIQPEAWNIDVNEDELTVELRSQLNWNQNCAVIKLM